MSDSEFEELVACLRGLASAVVAEGPRHPEFVHRLQRWTFEKSSGFASTMWQLEEDRIFWTSTSLHTWITSFGEYERVASILSRSIRAADWSKAHIVGTEDPVEPVAYVSIPNSGTVQAYGIGEGCSAPLWTSTIGGKVKRMSVRK